MSAIRVLVDKLPGGYAPILAYYNQNKQPHWSPICEAKVAEGGFEIPLNAEEIKNLKARGWGSLDYNDRVRQLRWSKGLLLPHLTFESLKREEIQLLGTALAAVLGADKVQFIQ
jgi:hypothetical protein